MNKTEQEVVEQLIHQLIALDDPSKKVYLKSFDYQVQLDTSYVERRYIIRLLEAYDK